MTDYIKGRGNLGAIWTRHCSDEWAHQDTWTAHPVTKITRKRIFIRDGLCGAQISLDREALQRGGRLQCERKTYYTEVAKRAEVRQSEKIHAETEAFRRANARQRLERTIANEANLLGLKAPWTRADVMNAFRREIQKHHPDRGGDPAIFRLVIEAKDRALANAKDDNPR